MLEDRRDQKERLVTPAAETNNSVIDRTRTCPFLLRVYCSQGGHHRAQEYEKNRPAGELQVHTWYACMSD